MSSFQLPLSPVLPQHMKYSSKTPIHANFSREGDALVFLWQTGYLEIYEMHTRLGPGREKVYNPAKIWSGFAADDDNTIRWRQIALKHNSESSSTVTVIGSTGSQEAIGSVKLEGGLALKQVVRLEKRNLRILDDVGERFQASNGEIYLCMYTLSFILSTLRLTPGFSSTKVRWTIGKTLSLSRILCTRARHQCNSRHQGW